MGEATEGLVVPRAQVSLLSWPFYLGLACSEPQVDKSGLTYALCRTRVNKLDSSLARVCGAPSVHLVAAAPYECRRGRMFAHVPVPGSDPGARERLDHRAYAIWRYARTAERRALVFTHSRREGRALSRAWRMPIPSYLGGYEGLSVENRVN